MVPCLHQNNVYIKRSYKEGEPKNVNTDSVQKTRKPVRFGKVTGFMQRCIWQAMEICAHSGLPIGIYGIPCFHQSNVCIKRKLKRRRAKNVNTDSVQKTHKPVRVGKVAGFRQRRLGPTMEICVHSRLPIGMVPCLHQSNVHINRKLKERRAQKCKH